MNLVIEANWTLTYLITKGNVNLMVMMFLMGMGMWWIVSFKDNWRLRSHAFDRYVSMSVKSLDVTGASNVVILD